MARPLLVALLFVSPGYAQVPVPHTLPHCYVEAVNVSDANEIRSHWETSWGSYDRDRAQRTVLRIRVGTTGRVSGPASVHWYFLGTNMSSGERVIYGQGERTLSIPAAYFSECYAAGPTAKSHDLNLVLARQRYTSGTISDGWIVAVTNDAEQVIGAKASSESLLQLFSRSDEFASLTKLNPRSAR